MRFSTVVSSLIALGVATSCGVVASVEQVAVPAAGLQSRDFERKLAVRSPKKHGHPRQGKLITNGMMTWYGKNQLDAPACGGPKPSKWDHIIAVKQGGSFKCHDEVHIHHNGKMVVAKVLDYCEGCDDNHIDATQGLFQEFADLDQGEIHGMHIRIMA